MSGASAPSTTGADADIWLAHKLYGWDYNGAYDVMHRMGISRNSLRIAPPSMNADGAELLAAASSAWPQWWKRVTDRLPGIKLGAQFGRRAVEPRRRYGETWHDTFDRECLGEHAPEWIRERAATMRDRLLHAHARHATTPLPDTSPCYNCVNNLGSWRGLTKAFYNGDPFSVKSSGQLPYVEPEFFRKGAGSWDGKPSW